MGNEVVVIDCWVSPFCMRVKIGLNEKGVLYEKREEKNVMGGKSELLLASNPTQSTRRCLSLFTMGSRPICESAIIVSYIDEAFPSSSSPLLPSCAYERAQARFWTDFLDKKVFEAGKAIWTSKGEEREVAKKEFIEILKQVEEGGGLGENDYFGFLDINAMGLASWFPAYEKVGEFEIVDHCPKLSAWINRCLHRPTVAQVIPQPDKVCHFVGMFRKMLGIVD